MYELLYSPSDGDSIEEPIDPKAERLPFHQIGWRRFERLCALLVEDELGIWDVRPYGTEGSKQHGIDIFGYDIGSKKFFVCQCKEVQRFGPADISGAIDKFLDGEWRQRASRLILAVTDTTASAQRSDAVAAAKERLDGAGIEFDLWDEPRLNALLLGKPKLVARIFGQAWADSVCGRVKRPWERIGGSAIAFALCALAATVLVLAQPRPPRASSVPTGTDGKPGSVAIAELAGSMREWNSKFLKPPSTPDAREALATSLISQVNDTPRAAEEPSIRRMLLVAYEMRISARIQMSRRSGLPNENPYISLAEEDLRQAIAIATKNDFKAGLIKLHSLYSDLYRFANLAVAGSQASKAVYLADHLDEKDIHPFSGSQALSRSQVSQFISDLRATAYYARGLYFINQLDAAPNADRPQIRTYALDDLEVALAEATSAGDAELAGSANHEKAILLQDAGKGKEAERSAQESTVELAGAESADTLPKVIFLQAQTLLASGKPSDAVNLLTHRFKEIKDGDYNDVSGQWLMLLSYALHLSNRNELAYEWYLLASIVQKNSAQADLPGNSRFSSTVRDDLISALADRARQDIERRVGPGQVAFRLAALRAGHLK